MESFVLFDPVILGLFFVAFIAGFIDAIAGGGGLLTVPAMLSSLSSGVFVSPQQVLGTNKLLSLFGSFTSAMTYIRHKVFDPKMWVICGIATVFGGIIGAFIATKMSSDLIKKIVPIVIIFVAIYMMVPKSKADNAKNETVLANSKQIPSGVVLGTYDGILGSGVGSFWIMLMNKVFKYDFIASVGIARFMTFLSNLSATLTFIYFGNAVNFKIGVIMGAANMLGSYVGAANAVRLGEKYIKPIFIFIVLCIAFRLLYLQIFPTP